MKEGKANTYDDKVSRAASRCSSDRTARARPIQSSRR